MANFILINPEDVPEDLEPGKYVTEIKRAVVVDDEMKLCVKFINKKYNPDDPQCLITLDKE